MISTFPRRGHRVTLIKPFLYRVPEGIRELQAGAILHEGYDPPPLAPQGPFGIEDGMTPEGWVYTVAHGHHEVIPRSSLLVEELTIGVIGSTVVPPRV